MGRVALNIENHSCPLFRSNIKILSNESWIDVRQCSESFPVIVYIQTKSTF